MEVESLLEEEEEEEEMLSCRRRREMVGLTGGEGDRGSLELSLRRGWGREPRGRIGEARQAEVTEEGERLGSARKVELA